MDIIRFSNRTYSEITFVPHPAINGFGPGACYRVLNLRKRMAFFFLVAFVSGTVFAQNASSNQEKQNEDILKRYIQSKGSDIIIFDSQNIKQFWIDKSVATQNGHFNIVLDRFNDQQIKFESVPLRIQLANVNEAQDCKVEIIADTKDFGFSIKNGNNQVLCTSSSENDFVHYTVASAVFHLEDTQKTTFSILFDSQKEKQLSIKKILLSFFNNINSTYLCSPGTIKYTSKNLSASKKKELNDGSISVTGKQSQIFSTNKIFPSGNLMSCTVTIKNIGENATQVSTGYGAYTQDKVWINGRSYPFQDNSEVLKVVSSLKGSDKIVVDAYSEWAKNCYLVFNAKEDLSDVPNSNFAGTILDVKRLENGQAEITLNKPLDSAIENGTYVRIHGQGGSYIYKTQKVLLPGEEETFSSTIRKDETILKYTPDAFSKGVYYVVPIIFSYSADPDKENTVLISNYTISY